MSISICTIYFGGVARILVPDNCKTAVVHNGGFKDQKINETYKEMAKHYDTTAVNTILTSKGVEPRTYRSCMGLLKLADKYSDVLPEAAC